MVKENQSKDTSHATSSSPCRQLDPAAVKAAVETASDFAFDLTLLKFLVVDDSRFCRKVVRDALGLFGVRRIHEPKTRFRQ